MHKTRESIDEQQKASGLIDFEFFYRQLCEPVKKRPVIFSNPMVQAIREGKKTMTRRIIKPQPDGELFGEGHFPRTKESIKKGWNGYKDGKPHLWGCRYGKPGEGLWVKETFMPALIGMDDGGIDQYGYIYKADGPACYKHIVEQMEDQRWKPSIYMPRVASRINLLITNIRVERLNQISHSDAIREGIEVIRERRPLPTVYKCYTGSHDDSGYYDPRMSFFSLWESINGFNSVELNPWVWVIEFGRIEK